LILRIPFRYSKTSSTSSILGIFSRYLKTSSISFGILCRHSKTSSTRSNLGILSRYSETISTRNSIQDIKKTFQPAGFLEFFSDIKNHFSGRIPEKEALTLMAKEIWFILDILPDNEEPF